VLLSRIRETDYWVEYIGLQIVIEFPKYSKTVKAVVPYKDEPVEFYLWWKSNPRRVKLTSKEKVVFKGWKASTSKVEGRG